MLDFYKENEPRGEYVLVVEGCQEIEKTSELSVEDELKMLIASGMRKNDAVKQVAQVRKINRKIFWGHISVHWTNISSLRGVV